jgi:hypothetical protein
MAWAMSESLEFGDALPTNLAFDVEHVLRDLGWKLARLSCWMYASNEPDSEMSYQSTTDY